MPVTTTRMTQQERADRRKEMADYVREGHTLYETAREFGVTAETVRDACRTHDVDIPHNLEPSTYEIIAALVLEKGSLKYFARRFNVSHQRISAIKKQCIEAGIPLGIGYRIGWKPTKVLA